MVHACENYSSLEQRSIEIDSRIIFPPSKEASPVKAPRKRFPIRSFIFISLRDHGSNIYRWRWRGARPSPLTIKTGFDSISRGNLSTPGWKLESRGRAIKGGHNCFQVVETLGPRKILSETVFQLPLPSTSRLPEISRKRMYPTAMYRDRCNAATLLVYRVSVFSFQTYFLFFFFESNLIRKFYR